MIRLNNVLCITLLTLLVIPSTGSALTTDEQEKLFIVSESAELDKQAGTSIYRNDVKVDNGSTHVTGHLLTTHSNANNQLEEIIIEGSQTTQAHYWTLTEPDKPELHAKADIIKYFPQKHLIILTGNASIEQGTDSIRGPLLEYDIEKQRLLAKPGTLVDGKPARTTIVIAPNSISSTQLAPTSAIKSN